MTFLFKCFASAFLYKTFTKTIFVGLLESTSLWVGIPVEVRLPIDGSPQTLRKRDPQWKLVLLLLLVMILYALPFFCLPTSYCNLYWPLSMLDYLPGPSQTSPLMGSTLDHFILKADKRRISTWECGPFSTIPQPTCKMARLIEVSLHSLTYLHHFALSQLKI